MRKQLHTQRLCFSTSVSCRKAFVVSAKKLDFLAEKFAAVPDLVDDEVREAPAKKQRCPEATDMQVCCCS